MYYCSKERQRGDWDDHKARCKKTRAMQIDAQEAIPGLPQDVVVKHILRCVTDPIVLARLKAVSRAMRDAVEKTGTIVWETTTEAAAEERSLDTLKQKLEKDRLSKSSVCQLAAKGGHLDVLQWVRLNGCPWDAETCVAAAMGGHREVLQWLHMNGCPWNDRTCVGAARSGHLGMLQWARENGCPWNKETCSTAAMHGHLEVMQWACANGCPWHEMTCVFAANGGQLGVLQWAIENGCPWNWNECMSSCAPDMFRMLPGSSINEEQDESDRLLVLACLNENTAPSAPTQLKKKNNKKKSRR